MQKVLLDTYRNVFLIFFILLTLSSYIIFFSPLLFDTRHYLLTTDFRAFYTASRIYLAHEPHLYSFENQYLWQRKLFPQISGRGMINPFRNPPFLILLFNLFASLPFELGYFFYLISNILLLFIILFLYRLLLPLKKLSDNLSFFLLMVTYGPVVSTLLLAQTSFLLVLSLVLGRLLLLKNHPFLTGLSLSIMSIKPQYLLPLAFFFLVKQQYKVILGLVCGCVVLLLISIILVGFAGLLEYIHFLLTTLNQWDSYTIHPTSMFTLESLLLNLTHSTSISSVRTLWYCLCLGVLMLFSLATWRRTKRETSSDLEWTLLIVTMILISPYTNIQDLSLLTAAGVFVARWIRITQRTTAKKILIGIICSGYILGQMIGVIWLLHNVTGYIMLLLCFYGVLCFILIQENYPGLQRHLLLMKKQLGSKK